MYRYRNNTCPCMQNNTPNQEIYYMNNDNNNSCSCGFNETSVFPESYMYGQSYVPIQYINETFSPEEGLRNGTMFPELVSPYEPCQGMAEIRYLREVTANEGRCPNAL